MKKILRSLLLFIMLFHNFVPLGQLVYSETISETSKNAVSTEMTSAIAGQTTQSTKADTQPTTTAPSSDSQHESQPATVSKTQEENTFSTTRPSAVRSNEQKNKKAEGPALLQLAKEPTPTITIDVVNEQLLGFDSKGKYEVRFGDRVVSVSDQTTFPITNDMMSKIWSIKRLGSQGITEDSEPQKLKIPGRAQLPDDWVTAVDETVKGANDGKLKGVNQTYEYRTGSGAWVKGTPGGTIENLAPNTYEIRIADGERFASPSIFKTIRAGLPKHPTPAITIDYEKELLQAFDENETYEIRFDENNIKTLTGQSEMKISEDMFSKVWWIVQIGDGQSIQNSDSQQLTITYRRTITEFSFNASPESEKGKNDGEIAGVSAEMEYRLKGNETWTLGPSNRVLKGLAPGDYEIRYKANNQTKTFASKIIVMTVEAGLPREEKPTIKIDYEAEELTGFDSTSKYEVNFGNDKRTVDGETSFKITDDMMSKGWNIIKLGDGTNTQNSEAQQLTIKARRALYENMVNAYDESAKDKQDGRLEGVNLSMEYRKAGDTTWLKGTSNGKITDLAPGEYEIRYFASNKNEVFASMIIKKTIKAGLPREEKPTIKINYEAEELTGFDSASKYEVNFGDDKRTVDGQTSFKITDDMMSKVWNIIKLGDGTNTQNSEAQQLIIKARRALYETMVNAYDESAKDKQDGRLEGVNLSMEYRKAGDTTWLKGTSNGKITDLAPGEYEIRYFASNKNEAFASVIIKKTIKAGLPREEKPTIKIDYEAEELSGFDSTSKYEVNFGNDKRTVDGQTSFKITDDMMSKVWNIIKLGDGTNTQNSEAQPLTIKARRALYETMINVHDESIKDKQDGRLEGVNLSMEYRKAGDTTWLKGTSNGKITDLAPGEYEIRYFASNKNEAFASVIIKKTIKEGPERQESLQVEPKSLDFEAPLGYDPNALLKEITITNSSEDKVTNIALTTSETAAFKIENTVINELDAGKSVNFTIAPVEDLTVGIYKMTVDISSDNAVTVSIPVSFEVFAEGKVVVRYQDDKGKDIADAEVFSGKIGERFTTERKEIEGYHFKEIQGNSSGTFSEKEQTITYVYTKQETVPEKGGDVTVNYVDEAGKKLAESELLSGNIGAAYETKQKTIKGYSFKELQGNAKGKFTSKAQTVTYIYKKTAVSGVTNATKPKSGGATSQKGSVSSQKALLKAGETRNRLVVFSGLVLVTCSIISLYVKRKYQMTDE